MGAGIRDEMSLWLLVGVAGLAVDGGWESGEQDGCGKDGKKAKCKVS